MFLICVPWHRIQVLASAWHGASWTILSSQDGSLQKSHMNTDHKWNLWCLDSIQSHLDILNVSEATLLQEKPVDQAYMHVDYDYKNMRDLFYRIPNGFRWVKGWLISVISNKTSSSIGPHLNFHHFAAFPVVHTLPPWADTSPNINASLNTSDQ